MLLVLTANAAIVTRIAEIDADGHWAEVASTSEAWVTRGDGRRDLLAVGTEVAEEEEVTTRQARVDLRLSDDDVITMYEGTIAAPQGWGVLQRIGTVLYEVRGMFSVRYGRTEAVVEGTRFVVAGTGPEPDSVRVDEGVVRVTGPGMNVRMKAGDRVDVGPQQPVEPDPPRRWRVGIDAGGGIGQQGAQVAPGAQVRADLFVRRQIVGPVRVSADVSLTNSLASSQFPVTLGLDYGFGAFSAGVHGTLQLGYGLHCQTQAPFLVARGGIEGELGAEVWLGDHWGLVARARGGWADGPFLHGTAGVEVGF